MDLRNLRLFVEVVRQGGFSRAAKTAFATQSTISKSVKQIEDEIGLPLIDRAAPGIQLTDAGQVVYGRAVTMLAERDDLWGELTELRGLQSGQLRIGLPPVGANLLFAPLFAHYARDYPGIEVRLVEQGSTRLAELVLAGDIELGGGLLPVSDEFQWQSVRLEPIDVLVSASHPLAGRSQIAMAELARQPLILFGEGFTLNTIIQNACARSGFTPQVVSRSTQMDFIVELVACGLGLGFLPRLIAQEKHHHGVCCIPVDDPCMVWHMAMIWRRGGYLSFAARAWLDLVGRVYG